MGYRNKVSRRNKMSKRNKVSRRNKMSKRNKMSRRNKMSKRNNRKYKKRTFRKTKGKKLRRIYKGGSPLGLQGNVEVTIDLQGEKDDGTVMYYFNIIHGNIKYTCVTRYSVLEALHKEIPKKA